MPGNSILHKMPKYCLLILCALCFVNRGHAQYHVNVKYELPAAGLFVIGSSFGFRALDKVASYTTDDIRYLDPASINAFDRPSALQNPVGFAKAHERSNLFLNISVLSPMLLALDKKARKDWLQLLTLYLATHAVDNTLYFATAFPIRRARPLTYNTQLSDEERTGLGKSNSFFSGHVSFSSTSTFFLVKVLTDYHQIKGWKRWALYGAASIPPAMVGYHRMRAGKHFKTDIITGFVVGASCGILVPELHKGKASISPYVTAEQSGFTLSIPLQ